MLGSLHRAGGVLNAVGARKQGSEDSSTEWSDSSLLYGLYLLDFVPNTSGEQFKTALSITSRQTTLITADMVLLGKQSSVKLRHSKCAHV